VIYFFFFFFEDNTYPHSNPFNLYLFYIELKAILSFYHAFCKDKKLFDHKYSRKGGDKEKKSNNNAILTSHVIKNKFNNILWLIYNKNNINIQYFDDSIIIIDQDLSNEGHHLTFLRQIYNLHPLSFTTSVKMKASFFIFFLNYF